MADKAVALKYDAKDARAPKVVASARNKLACEIIKKAQEFDIPLFANELLVNSLIDLEIDKEIPTELYKGVSEVFIWLIKNEATSKKNNQN